MSELVHAASALVVHEDRVLLVRSATTREQWAFPGGKAERGETPEQTAIREVKEEVGLDIEVTEKLGTYVTPSGFDIVCLVAAAGTNVLTIDPEEIIEAKWYPFEDALHLRLVSSVREALGKFHSSSERGRT